MSINWDEAFEEVAAETKKVNDAVVASPAYQAKVARDRAAAAAKLEADIADGLCDADGNYPEVDEDDEEGGE